MQSARAVCIKRKRQKPMERKPNLTGNGSKKKKDNPNSERGT